MKSLHIYIIRCTLLVAMLFTVSWANAQNEEIFAVEEGQTITPNQPITATQSIVVTPGNDTEWPTNMSMGSAWVNPLEFTASIYYPNSTTTYTFVNSMRGTNNPKDGDLQGDGTNAGNGYKYNQKNLPVSGGFLVFEAKQSGSLIVPIRVFANKPLYVTDGNGKAKTDIQFKDADGTTYTLLTTTLCAVSETDDVTGFVSFNVTQGEKYYVFCTGSKARFGGYVFSTESINIDPATMKDVKGILDAEPYAILENNVLTFYYDDQKQAKNGMSVGPFTQGSDREWNDKSAEITKVVFDESFANETTITSTGYWFSGFTQLASIEGLNYLNTSNVEDMWAMFENCKALNTVDLIHSDTRNVKTMGFMFSGCENLQNLDVSSFNTANVTHTNAMFANCFSLTSLDLSGFNTKKVENMYDMFLNCTHLTTIYAGSEWSTEVSTGGINMFAGCTNLKGGAGTTYDAGHVDHTYARIDGGESNPGYFTAATEEQPSTDESNLYPAKNIVWRDITWKNANNKKDKDNNDMPFLMGSGLGYKTILAESVYREEQGTNVTRPYYTYIDHEAGEKGVPGFGLYYKFTPKVSGQLRFNTWVNKGNRKTFIIKASDGTPLEPYVDYTFDGYLNGQNQPETGYPLYFTADEIKSRHDESGTVNKYVVVTGQAFWGWITVNLNGGESYYIYQQSSQLGFGGYDFTPVGGTTENYVSCIRSSNNDGTFVLSPEFAAVVDENGRAMNVDEKGSFVKFGTTNMDVEALGSAEVESVEADLDIQRQSYAVLSENNTVLTFFYDDQMNTRGGMSVADRGWSQDASSITKVQFDSTFVNYYPTSTREWFNGCLNLTSIVDMKYLKLDRTTDMSGMFLACTSLASLDVSGFNTQQVTNMQDMFRACTNLTSLDLSRFNTQNVTEMYGMFYDCTNLKSLDLSNFDTRNVRNMDHLFRFCTNLVNLNISGFSTANGASQRNMFEGCSSLASIQAGNAVIADSTYAQIQNPNLLLYVNEASQAPQSVKNVVVLDAAEQIVLIDTSGNNNFYCPKQFTAKSISYTRNFKQTTQVGVSRGWETIALPFAVQTITHEKNGTLTPFGVEGGKPFWLKELTNNGLVSARHIDANVPYLISMPNNSIYPDDYNQAGNVTFSATNAVVPVTENRETSGNNRMLIPTMMSVAQSPDIYVINRDTTYQNNPQGSIFVADYREVRPFEAYVKHVGGARYFSLSEIPQLDVTGIESIELQPWKGEQWWTLDGRKLNRRPSKKGIYIRNGKKVVVDATF